MLDRRSWLVVVSLALQCGLVALLLLIPLLHPETLGLQPVPQPKVIRTWVTLPPLRRAAIVHTASTAPSVFTPTVQRPVFVLPSAPVASPRSVDMPVGDPEITVWSGLVSAPSGPALPSAIALPPRIEAAKPPASPKPIVSGPLQVGGEVQSAKLAFGPSPIYPPLAKTARSQGLVKLAATIAVDGSIRNLRVVSGPPLLVDAAVEAVRQWRYRPTLLNGIAVEVLTEIDVNFSLTR